MPHHPACPAVRSSGIRGGCRRTEDPRGLAPSIDINRLLFSREQIEQERPESTGFQKLGDRAIPRAESTAAASVRDNHEARRALGYAQIGANLSGVTMYVARASPRCELCAQITARASPDVWRTCASRAFERLHHVRITQIPRQHATANIERYYSSALRTRRAFCSAKKYSSAAIRPSTRRDPSTRRIRTPAVEAGMRRGRSRRIVQGGLLDPAVHAIGIGQSASTAMTLNPLCVINAY